MVRNNFNSNDCIVLLLVNKNFAIFKREFDIDCYTFFFPIEPLGIIINL